MNELAARYAEFTAKGRAVLLGGTQTYDTQPVEGGRWGASTALRPTGPVLDTLTELCAELRTVLSAEHWIHPAENWHLTVRSVEAHRSAIPSDDPRVRAYAEALDEVTADLPATRVELRGVAAHHGGVVVFGYPCDDVLETLRANYAEAAHRKGVGEVEYWIRDVWYLSLVHFGGVLADPTGLVSWSDSHRDQVFGVAELPDVELLRWHWTGSGVRVGVLHRSAFAGSI